MVAGIFVTFGRRYGPPSGQPALPYLAATGLAEELHVKKPLLYAAPWPQSTVLCSWLSELALFGAQTLRCIHSAPIRRFALTDFMAFGGRAFATPGKSFKMRSLRCRFYEASQTVYAAEAA
jgi:hypothetical protein